MDFDNPVEGDCALEAWDSGMGYYLIPSNLQEFANARALGIRTLVLTADGREAEYARLNEYRGGQWVSVAVWSAEKGVVWNE